MTSFCNIFKPIDSLTGNFLLFSQYAEDLSRSVVDSNYNVRPSRFVCMNLESSDITNMSSYISPLVQVPATGTSVIPQFFQDSFENVVARAKNTQGLTYDLHNFSTEFWYHMGMATKSGSSFDLHNKVNYIGNIDLSTWDNGFADIILNINSGTEKQKYKVNKSTYSSRNWSDIETFKTDCGKWTFTQPSMIEGWQAGDNLPISGGLKTVSNVSGFGRYTYNGTSHATSTVDTGNNTNSVIDNMITIDSSGSVPDSFVFNTIVILYDIKNGDTIIAKDIPMGVYFTGTVDNNSITNPVTIYKSSDVAYGAGTGWSLRISTRFSPTPMGLVQVEPVALESGDALYQSISAQMSAVAELIKAQRDGLKNVTEVSQNIADFINDFKNTRMVNIPYVVDGYWFVNGGNTGFSANALGVNEAEPWQINEIIARG